MEWSEGSKVLDFTIFTCLSDFNLIDHKGRRVGSRIDLLYGGRKWYLSSEVTRDQITFGKREPKLKEFDTREEAEAAAQKILLLQHKSYLRRPHRFKSAPDNPHEEM